jgi:hypothetical protein
MDINVPLLELREEFERLVKPTTTGSLSDNNRRQGWQRYAFYKDARFVPKGRTKELSRSLEDFPAIHDFLCTNFSDSKVAGAKYAVVPPGGIIGIHQDGHSRNNPRLNEYVDRTVRVHVPIYTTQGAKLLIGKRFQHIPEGEVWMINNHAFHGVINEEGSPDRNHLIIDLFPGKGLLEMIEKGDQRQGAIDYRSLKTLVRNSAPGKVTKFRRKLPFVTRVAMKLHSI